MGSAPVEAESDGCEHYITISDPKLEPIFMLMRCSDSKITSGSGGGGGAAEYGAARSWIRSQLDTGLNEPSPLLRVAYADMCARELLDDEHPYPAAAIGCAWQTDRIDAAATKAALAARRDGDAIAKRLAADIKTVHELVEKAYPKATNAREWEVFYNLPSRVLKDARARRTANAAAYQRIAAFDAAIQTGKFEGCAAPLRETLAAHLKGATTKDALIEKLADPVGYALADALARCHYYSENELKAGVILSLLSHSRRQVSIAEEIYFAEIDALAADEPKARKFPNLVGSKYSRVSPSDLRPIEPYAPTELERNWFSKQYSLANDLGGADGRVERLVPSSNGVTLHFKKERVPVVDVRCHETDKIDTITDEGKIKYREVCTYTPKGMTWSQPQPITVDEATGVTAGRFVRIAQDAGKSVIASAADGPNEDARITRLADVVLAR
jgi:hypothetical protein